LSSPPNKPAALPLTRRTRPWGEGLKLTHAPWLTEAGDAPPQSKFSKDSAAEFQSHFRRLARYAEPKNEKARGVTGMEEKVKAIARPAASRSLREAIRKARLDEAERLGVAADNRDGEIARLELLKSELETVFAEIPQQDDRFNLALVPSRPARLWIDMFTYVAVDDGSGAYLFIRNSENGRRTMYSATNVADMADRITTYMAHEIVRRERIEAALTESGSRQKMVVDSESSGPGMGVVLSAFIIGVVTGAAGLFAAVWLSIP
jgi:hypothetical protein